MRTKVHSKEANTLQAKPLLKPSDQGITCLNFEDHCVLLATRQFTHVLVLLITNERWHSALL